jgi:hypothetical protein
MITKMQINLADRRFLQAIVQNAEALANDAKVEASNPHWKRLMLALAEAADNVDAHLARDYADIPSSDINEARSYYFSVGGLESDLGPRTNSSWYWRRAAKLLADRAGVDPYAKKRE